MTNEEAIKILKCCIIDKCEDCPLKVENAYACPESSFAPTFVEVPKDVLLQVLELLRERQPVVDTMPMVRCKDCKYSCACYSDGGEDLYDCCKDVIFGNADTTTLRTSDWFCADGKRYDE